MERKPQGWESRAVPAVPGLKTRIEALSELYPDLPFEALVRIFRLAPGPGTGQLPEKSLEEDSK